MPSLSSYNQFGGVHPETAALSNVLAASGVTNPHTGKPLSEALLFGIGGGLGAGYIMYEFQEHHLKIIILGFHNQWQYPIRYFQTLCDRLNVKISLPETGNRKVAEKTLLTALQQDKPALSWVDRAHLSYLQLPDSMNGHLGHFVAICGQEGDNFLLDDRAEQPFYVPAAELADARARIGSYKNRLLLVENFEPFNLEKSVQEGLQACVQHLGNESESFSLPTFRKWGKMMTDAKNKKGWLTLFKDPRGLYGTLVSIFEGIELNIGQHALRGLYASFLTEAATITGNKALLAVADQYAALAQNWQIFAESTLPDDFEPFAGTKALLRARHETLMQGGNAWQNTKSQTEQLHTLSASFHREFPLDEAAMQQLFVTLQEQLLSLYSAETTALAHLNTALVAH